MDTHDICIEFVKKNILSNNINNNTKFLDIVKSYYYNNELNKTSFNFIKKSFNLEGKTESETNDNILYFLQNIRDTTYDCMSNLIYVDSNDIGIIPHHKKCKLEKFMGSLDKIKTEEDFMKWNLDNSKDSELIISEKLDGISALLTIYKNDVKLCTRGNGEIGCDITHILKYMDSVNKSINKIRTVFDKMYKKSLNIRGELIIPTNNNENNMRNIVSGIVHVKDITTDIIEKIKSVHFVAYRLYDFDMNFSKQFEILTEMNMRIPQFVSIKTCNMNKLRDIQTMFVRNSKYQIDGIVISTDINIGDDSTGNNPKHSIALKIIGKSVQTKVLDIEWNVSKHGLLKPRIKIEPICINGANINWVTGINAKYIVQNNIGKNTILEIERSGDVIPNIKSVVTPTKYSLPENIKWEWNKTAVDIQIIQHEGINESPEMEIQKLLHFFKELETPHLGPKTIETIYNSGFTTIPQFLSITKNSLLEKCGYKDKSSENILKGIEFCKQQISEYLYFDNTNKSSKKYILMYASGCFGFGIGNKKIKNILDVFPNIENECNFTDEIAEYKKNELINKIKSIKGIQEQADGFIDGLLKYNIFIKNIKQYLNINDTSKIVETYHPETNNKIKITNQNITFTGFRDSKLKKILEENGNEVNDNVTKSTTLLIYKGENSSSKCEKAKKMEIKSMEYSLFMKEFF
jgi:DNA ligase (NAD+)